MPYPDHFILEAPYKPTGDQPEAIAQPGGRGAKGR